MAKLKAKWKAGAEYLPPFTIKESVDTLLQADKIFAKGTLTYDEATELVIKFRETNESFSDDEVDKAIVEDIKKELKDDNT